MTVLDDAGLSKECALCLVIMAADSGVLCGFGMVKEHTDLDSNCFGTVDYQTLNMINNTL